MGAAGVVGAGAGQGRWAGVLGDAVGLALDCGPGWTVSDALRLAPTLEPLHVL